MLQLIAIYPCPRNDTVSKFHCQPNDTEAAEVVVAEVVAVAVAVVAEEVAVVAEEVAVVAGEEEAEEEVAAAVAVAVAAEV